jgi:lysophospholipase L1-like esterase
LRLDRDVISEKPDAVLIQAGINDIKTFGAHRAHEDVIYAGLKNICVDNITAIVNKLTGERIKVILLTILPAGKPSLMRIPVWSDSIYDLVNDVNKDLSRLENEYVNVVNCDALGTGGRIKPQYSKDALHLNEEGHRKLNETVKPALERLLTETGN